MLIGQDVTFSKVSNLPDLIQQLKINYGIVRIPAEKDHTTSDRQAFFRKAQQCEDLQRRLFESEKMNELLRRQLAERASINHNEEELIQLREKVSRFQKTFQDQEKFVQKLKEMLHVKEKQLDKLVDDYEKQISQLTTKVQQLPQKDQVRILKHDIKSLNGMMKEQEKIMLELLRKNAKLQQTVERLKKTPSIEDSKIDVQNSCLQ